VAVDRIVAIVSSDSAPMRRLIQECRKDGRLVDATQGRRTKCLVFMDTGQIVLSALSRETLARRAGSREPMALNEAE